MIDTQQKTLAREYYPPRGSLFLGFEREARGVAVRTDAPDPTPSRAAQLANHARKRRADEEQGKLFPYSNICHF